MQSALQDVGVTDVDVSAVLNAADTNGDGCIDYEVRSRGTDTLHAATAMLHTFKWVWDYWGSADKP